MINLLFIYCNKILCKFSNNFWKIIKALIFFTAQMLIQWMVFTVLH